GQVGARADAQHQRALAEGGETRRRLDAVAAVVAGAGEDDDAFGVRRDRERQPRDRVAGTCHQREGRSAGERGVFAAPGRCAAEKRDPGDRRVEPFDVAHRARSRSMPRPSIAISGLRPTIASATRRAEPAASAQPLPPWPTLSQMPSAPLAPRTGGPSGSIGRAPFQRCAASRRVTPGNQSSSTLSSVACARTLWCAASPPISALPATRTRWPSLLIATL